MSIFKGSAVALITPFKNQKIDYDAVERLINWHIENNTDAIVICGTTGEASTLSELEKISLVEFAVRTSNSRVPIIAGSGTNDTSKSVFLSKEFYYAGVDGLLVVTPYYNKATQEGLIKHYNTIADCTPLPIILYSVKSRTGLNISADTVEELKKHPNIVGIKEASSDISQIVKIATLIDESFDLYSGNDEQTVPIMALGGIGCISTVANIIPNLYHSMCIDCLENNYEGAMEKTKNILPLIDACFAEVNPMPVKSALNMLGFIEKEYRMPMCSPKAQTEYLLFDAMKHLDLNLEQ